MKISIDTREDSHDDIKKVIKMLQNLVGDSQEIFTNEPDAASNTDTGSAFNSLFGDSSSTPQETDADSETNQEEPPTSAQEGAEAKQEEISDSTEDLFAELFSEEELKKMEATPAKEEEKEEREEELPKSKSKKHSIEFY